MIILKRFLTGMISGWGDTQLRFSWKVSTACWSFRMVVFWQAYLRIWNRQWTFNYIHI